MNDVVYYGGYINARFVKKMADFRSFTHSRYRMVSPVGSKIPETVVGEFHCNTKAAGWLNGAHPTGKFCTMLAKFEKFRFKL